MEKIALLADRVFSSDEDFRPRALCCVVVQDDRILSLETSLPEGCDRVIDLPGTTLLPGLINAHTHVSILPGLGDQITQMGRSLEAQLESSRSNMLSELASGVTTARILGQEYGVDFALRNEIDANQIPGPDLLCAGWYLTKPGAHAYALTGIGGKTTGAGLIDRNASQGARWTKIFATAGVSSAGPTNDAPFETAEIEQIVRHSHDHGLPVAAHAHGGEGAINAIEGGVDTIEHAALFEERHIELALRKGVDVVGTFSIVSHPGGIEFGDRSNPRIQDALERARETMASRWERILESGIPIALGTDSMHACMAFEVARLVEFGASNERALLCATSGGAKVCRVRADRGVLRPGFRADLVAVLGDPLVDIRVLAAPVLVMKRGKIFHQI